MRCGRCGYEGEADSRFCGRCGAPVAKADPPPRKRRWPFAVLALSATAAGLVTTVIIVDRVSKKPGEKAGPPPVVGKADTENLPPQVRSFTARAAKLDAGGSTELSADIWDPEGDPYYAWWSSSCGVIAPRADEPGRALFLAPAAPGACTVTVELKDHEMRRPRALTYTLVVAGSGS
jgi:hypothetical protein